MVRCVRFCHGGLSDGRTEWGWVAMGNMSCYFTTVFALLLHRDREGREVYVRLVLFVWCIVRSDSVIP